MIELMVPYLMIVSHKVKSVFCFVSPGVARISFVSEEFYLYNQFSFYKVSDCGLLGPACVSSVMARYHRIIVFQHVTLSLSMVAASGLWRKSNQ